MTLEHRVEPHERERLAMLWESARGLSRDQREKLFESHSLDGALRDELESLLAGADAAEAFFDQLRSVIPQGPFERATKSEAAADVGVDPMLGATVGNCQIVSRLGLGGMGVVYRAVDLRLRRTVALKLLRTVPRDERAKEQLLDEARAAASLDHPNICTIYEVGETSARLPFIAMAFYDGVTLEQVVARGPLPLSTALDYATQIARGLGAAHERGIVHRDVKPANIIVTTDGVVKLLDFGIARMRDAAVSEEHVTPGTIAYMSPEQVTSRPVDARTDLWSLGVVLYEMCTGVRPFAGDTSGAILYAIVREELAPASTLRRDLSRHVDALIERLLTKDPDERYRDAGELIASLASSDEHVLNRAPVGSTSAPPRVHWWSRPMVWYAAAVIALGALVLSRPRLSSPATSERRIAAEDLYRQGNRDVLFRSEKGREQALDFLQRAIALDPDYAPAHAALTHLLVMTADDKGGFRPQQLVVAENAAKTAIALDSGLADAHAALGHVRLVDYRFAEAEHEFKRAVELDEKAPYVREFLVWLYVFMDQPRDALEQANRALRDSPGSPTLIAEAARALLVNGRCAEALALLGRLAYLQPPPARTAAIAAQCYAQEKRWPQAIETMRPVAERNPLMAEPWLGFMLARAGQTDEARRIQGELLDRWRRGNGDAFGVAVIYAGLHDFDKAFVWLNRSIDDRSLRYDIMEPAFEDLRRDARFDGVRMRLGIERH